MIKTIQLLGQLGINKDVQAQELPDNAWSDGTNVRFRNGHLERMKGEQKVFDTPSVTPYWLQPYYTNNKRYWVHAGLAKVFADDGSTRTEITPTTAPTGGIDDRWTGGVLNGVLVMNNGKDVPWYWDTSVGVNKLVPLPGWDTTYRAKSIRPFKNVLVAVGIMKGTVAYPHLVMWSDVAQPGAVPQSWNVADLTKLAGDLDLAEDPSLLVDQQVMGDVNVIYKENSMYAMRATGGVDVFSFQRLPGKVGLLARGCVVDTPGGHVLLTHGDVVVHAGQGTKSIIDGRMRRWLFQTIDDTTRNRSFLVANPPANEVWVCFPDLGSETCTYALVWNWSDNTLSIRNLNRATYGASGQLDGVATKQWDQQNYAWQDATSAWNESELSPAQERLLMCSAAPLISAVDVTGTINGASYTSWVERTDLSFGDASRVKVVRNLFVRIAGSKGTRLQFQLGGRKNTEQAIVWSPPVQYVVGMNDDGQVDSFASGKFIGLRVQSLDNQPWRMTSLDVEYEQTGRY